MGLALVAAGIGSQATVLAQGELEVPYLSGRVVDDANMLSPAEESALTSQLEALETDTGAQMAVLTVDSLEGNPIEDYSFRVAESWGLGAEARDDGVLLLIAPNDRRMRIEVGYGLEPVIPDLAARRIQDEVLRPKFREAADQKRPGAYAEGISAAIERIAQAIEGEIDLTEESGSEFEAFQGAPDLAFAIIFLGIFFFVASIFALVALLTPGVVGWSIYGIMAPMHFIFPGVALGLEWGLFFLLLWLIGFPIVRGAARSMIQSSGAGKLSKKLEEFFENLGSGSGGIGGGGVSGWSGGFGSGGFSSGGFGGGGFSGGGGSFGGGGASGSW